MNIPDTFTLVITEEDRQSADGFCSNENCLVGACINRTFPEYRWIEGVDEVVAMIPGDFQIWKHERLDDIELLVDDLAMSKPFYKPAVVGKRIICTRQN
jgi:hypothetical protein